MTRIYLNILRAASILEGTDLEELATRYPEGDYFALKLKDKAYICQPAEAKDENKTVDVVTVLEVPAEYLGLNAEAIWARKERADLEAAIQALRQRINGTRGFNIPLQEGRIEELRGKLDRAVDTLADLGKQAYDAEQEMFRLEMQLNALNALNALKREEP